MGNYFKNSQIIIIFITISAVALFLGLSSNLETAEAKSYDISDSKTWTNTTITTDSIYVKSSGSLEIHNCTIVMNNSHITQDLLNRSEPPAKFISHGNLKIIGSSVIPLNQSKKLTYEFKSYGSSIVQKNNFLHATTLEFFNNNSLIESNVIRETKNDGIYLRPIGKSEKIPIIRNNSILKSGLNGIRLVSSNGDITDNSIKSPGYGGIYIHNSQINITNTTVKEPGQLDETFETTYLILNGKSVAHIHTDSDIERVNIHFHDSRSKVYVHNGDDINIIDSPVADSSESQTNAFKIMGVGVIILIAIAGIYTVLNWGSINLKREKVNPTISSLSRVKKNNREKPKERMEQLKSDVQVQFGDMAFAGGEYDSASQYYSNAVELNPDSDTVHYKYAMALEKTGDAQNAILHYTKSLELDRHNLRAKRSLERLEKQQIRDSDDIYTKEETGVSAIPEENEKNKIEPMAKRKEKPETTGLRGEIEKSEKEEKGLADLSEELKGNEPKQESGMKKPMVNVEPKSLISETDIPDGSPSLGNIFGNLQDKNQPVENEEESIKQEEEKDEFQKRTPEIVAMEKLFESLKNRKQSLANEKKSRDRGEHADKNLYDYSDEEIEEDVRDIENEIRLLLSMLKKKKRRLRRRQSE